ncbi:MAG: fumarylacetoacetate hydrolase family protein [Gammaproteobacteria bacterium]|nr:fumarylacetoacetate hydrolase family protein [Gammaproteobacteria bacterium]
MRTGRVVHGGRVRIVNILDGGALRAGDGTLLSPGEITWLPPAHGMVIGVALNHAAHAAQLRAVFHAPPYREPPRTPVLFIKPETTITAHGAFVQHPDGVPAIHAGPSLAVVMGKTARRVPQVDAFRFIKGYTILNDFTLPEDSYFRPPIRAKCFDSFGPLGPWVVGMEELADPRNVTLRTLVNGELRQEFSTRDLIRSIPELIESISSFMTLREDDVIAAGFAPDRVTVAAGDTVTVEATGNGSLTSVIVTEREYYESVDAMETAA